MTPGMISAAQPEAAETGADILRAGGNVVDAAVATALVQTVVDPQMCGIAGMGCMHLYLPAIGHNTPEYIRIVAEAMKIATADKDAHVGDPRFVDVPVDRLTSKDYAAQCADRIRRGEKTLVPRYNSGGAESRHTTQLCIADHAGNAVTMTHTLGQPSGVITPGLGFMYNGAMAVFDPRPGHAGSLAPGKSRFSALSPTIVFGGDQPFLVLGAPGATYITMGNLQVMLNVIDFGMNAEAAVSAPRFAAVSDTIELSNRILRSAERALLAQGYPVRRHPHSYTFAWVHAIRIIDGAMDGGADPATGGLVLQVTRGSVVNGERGPLARGAP